MASCACPAQTATTQEGEAVWADIPDGRLKAQVFQGEDAVEAPILLVVLHGDLLGPGSVDPYHHRFAREVAGRRNDVVAAALLRPGYSDAAGDRSDGEPFLATGDNYTAAAVDAVADATQHLKSAYRARAVVVVGHSGGAAITALMLARRPGIADAAVLAACPCDLPAWREHMMAERPDPVWRQPIDGLSPLDHVVDVSPTATIRLFVGENDRVTPPAYTKAYADALRQQGIDVRSFTLPASGHEILLENEVLESTTELIDRF